MQLTFYWLKYKKSVVLLQCYTVELSTHTTVFYSGTQFP